MDTLLLKKLNKPNLISGGVVKPSEITTGIIQLETIACGAELPIVTGGGIIKNNTGGGSSGGSGGSSGAKTWTQTGNVTSDGIGEYTMVGTHTDTLANFPTVWANGKDGCPTTQPESKVDLRYSGYSSADKWWSNGRLMLNFDFPLKFKTIDIAFKTTYGYSGMGLELFNSTSGTDESVFLDRFKEYTYESDADEGSAGDYHSSGVLIYDSYPSKPFRYSHYRVVRFSPEVVADKLFIHAYNHDSSGNGCHVYAIHVEADYV